MIAGKLPGLVAIVMLLATSTAAHAACTLDEFTPTGIFAAVATGPDGNVWFALTRGIGRITPDGVITEFALPAGTESPRDITAGPDGGVWFTTRTEGLALAQLGRMGPDGAVTLFALPGTSPGGVVTGPDGNLWVSTSSGIARVTPTGVITTFPAVAGAITAGPDGALWFNMGFQRLGRITTGGAITEFPLPDGILGAGAITAGADGNLWFTVSLVGIGRITPAGAVTIFPVPGGAATHPRRITLGPDGNVWFMDQFGSVEEQPRIGRITPAGVLSEFSVRRARLLGGITTGGDGRLWFAGGGSIFRLTLPPFADVPLDHWAVDPIVALFQTGVSAGCGVDPRTFCPEDPVTRGQLAALLLRAEAPGVTPPPCSSAPFDDVPCTHPFAPWIAALAARGLTAGCGPRLYCPEQPVSRAELAVLLVRLVAGPDFVPAPCTAPAFGDVPCSSPFAPWIQELVSRGIAAGCAPGRFCPGGAATRAEIAVLLTRAFPLGVC